MGFLSGGKPKSRDVMPGLVPGIHVLDKNKDVDGRDEPGHDAYGINAARGSGYFAGGL
jgi:hypothetical protein